MSSPTLSKVFSYESLVHAIAGATGGATAITVSTLRPKDCTDFFCVVSPFPHLLFLLFFLD